MTPNEAFVFSRDNNVPITHDHFTDNEWVKVIDHDRIETEDGYVMGIYEFMSYRTSDSWMSGWKPWTENVYKETLESYSETIKELSGMTHSSVKSVTGIPVSVRTTPKIGRNERCVCGSDKKSKNCCGKYYQI